VNPSQHDGFVFVVSSVYYFVAFSVVLFCVILNITVASHVIISMYLMYFDNVFIPDLTDGE